MTSISAGSAFYKVQNALDNNSRNVAKSMERLATGQRGVSIGDRPASTAIAGSMKMAMASAKLGVQNIAEAMSAVEVINNDLKLLANVLVRMEELHTLGGNGLNSTADIITLEDEGDGLVSEWDVIQARSDWGASALWAASAQKTISFGMNSTALIIGAVTLAGTVTAAKLKDGTDTVAIAADKASLDVQMITVANQYRVLENNLSHLSSLSASYALDISAKLDVDFAGETTELAKGQILAQAGTAMLAQANAQGQGMLALIQS